MLTQTQKDWGLLVRFLICACFVGFTGANCVPEKCGLVNVSYPFWISNPHCGHPDFQITCSKDEDTGMPALFFRSYTCNSTCVQNDVFSVSTLNAYDFNIMEIDYEGHLVINSSLIKAYSCDSNTIARTLFVLPESGTNHKHSFTLSSSNRLVVIGSQAIGSYYISSLGETKCGPIDYRSEQQFCRDGCCEINLPDNWGWINFTAGVSPNNNISSGVTAACGLSTIMDPSTFTVVDNETNLFWGNGLKAYYGLRLNWGIGEQDCATAKGRADYSCSTIAQCLDSPSGKGYVCKCLPGYEGNGYSNGTDCTDIDECRYRSLNKCVGEDGGGLCHNLPGSYNCSCGKGYDGDGFSNGTGCIDVNECRNKWSNRCVGAEEGGICLNLASSYTCSCSKGYVGDGYTNGTGCISTSSNSIVFPAIIGSVTSFVVVSLAASLLVWWLRKRQLKLVEAKYFQRLQEYMACTVGRESLRIFSAKELARASNNYSKEMVLGTGGFGTVFKGVLLNGTLVAIKKSKQALNLKEDHDFLNEITILSQINHRNIVKLLGCCIQTKFPMLVSEFVPNGTLFQHLHSKEQVFPWASRLQIAIETAEALAYLHSGASQPIFHRDIKSSNILLNEKLSPKVTDFGISRLITASNNTHVTTCNIKGTWGYLDPEYFQTYQLTEKSDVYSFGVVLVELLTGLKPISEKRDTNEMGLSSLFLSRLNDNRLTEILDSNVLEDETLQEMEDMARIARQCLHLKRRRRPSMKEVLEELVWMRGGKRITNFHENIICDDGIFEQTSVSREASQMPYRFRSYTFPSANGNTSEDPSNVMVQMSILSE